MEGLRFQCKSNVDRVKAPDVVVVRFNLSSLPNQISLSKPRRDFKFLGGRATLKIVRRWRVASRPAIYKQSERSSEQKLCKGMLTFREAIVMYLSP